MSDLFDDLRSDAGGPMNLDDEGDGLSSNRYDSFEYQDLDDDPRPVDEQDRKRKKSGKKAKGMSPGQRMILAFLLFMLSLIFSTACLFVTGRIVPF